MKRWEYMSLTEHIGDEYRGMARARAHDIEKLNRLGAEGWEVVLIQPARMMSINYLLKREIVS